MVAITGNTYPVKDRLREECQAKWNPADKAWMVPEDQAERARAIVASVPAEKKRTFRRGGCRCDGRPGGYCCGRRDCQCYDCQ